MISVVVPIYNSSKYLRTCIDSILSQTVMPKELLLIDDGSTDQSGEICDEYAKEYEFINVFHREHKGLVDGRKFGASNAKGEYISFIDSDDWVTDGFIEDAERIINLYEPDIISYSFEKIFGDTKAYRTDGIPEGLYLGKDIESSLGVVVNENPFFTPFLVPSIATKVFKRQIFERYIEKVNSVIEKGEDVAVTLPMSFGVESIYVSKKAFYRYVSRNNSMSWDEDSEEYSRFLELIRHLGSSLKELGKKGVYQEYLILLTYHYLLDNLSSVPESYMAQRDELPCWSGVKRGMRIIVYGKGLFANNLIHVIKRSAFCEIVDNIDSGDAKEKLLAISEDAYDKIVISIADSGIIRSVKALLTEAGVLSEKISCIDKNRLSIEDLPKEIRDLFI